MNEIQSPKQYDLEKRTLTFAKSVRDFVSKIPRTIANIEDGKQVIRSSGSVGANYIEANEALSKKDFFYTRGKYNYDENMHVNEQTPRSLRKLLKNFKARVWCDDGSSNVMSLLTKNFAGADIWAAARLKK